MAKRVPDPEQLRDEMRSLVRQAAEPARPGESVKAAIGRAARLLGLSHGRVKRYWYGEILVPPAHEVDAARSALSGRLPTTTADHLGIVSHFHVIYDENGRVWPAGSRELREGLGYTVGDFDIGGFAVRCLGWVEVRHLPGRVHVRIAPRVVQPKPLDALQGLLSSMPQTEVLLEVRVGQTWEEEILPSAVEAAGKIESLVKGPADETGGRFVSVRQPISVLFRDKQRYLIEMFNQARAFHVASSLEALVNFAEADPTGRTGVAAGTGYGSQGRRTGWSMAHIGRALRFYTEEDRRSIIGSDLTRGPDGEYGKWCNLGYDRVEAAGEPVVEDVRALVLRRQGPPLESRYRRLLVPVTVASGQSVILCSSEIRQQQAA